MFGLPCGDTTALPAIAIVVSDIARDFLRLASTLKHQEVPIPRVTELSIEDEFTRFKVIQEVLYL